MIIDQLQGIHITGVDDRIDALRIGLHGERTQNIIGLEAVLLVDLDAKSLDNLANTAKLGSHVVGQGRTVRLVGSKLLVTERGCRPVKGYSNVIRLFL